MAREGVVAVLLFAVNHLMKEADDMASVLQMVQLICSNKHCCELVLKQPFIAAFSEVHQSFVDDTVINETVLCILWYLSNCEGIADVLFEEDPFELVRDMMTDFKRNTVIQTWTCKLLYNLSLRYDCLAPLRDSLITRNLLQVVNDFPDNDDILRPALRAISNLLSKEMIQQIDVVSLLDTACRKKFVLEIMELICNLAKSLTSYTTIHVKDILDPMVLVMKRFRGNVEIIVKTLQVIEMMIPADPDGEQLKEANLLKIVVGVSDMYEDNGEVQAAVYRTFPRTSGGWCSTWTA